MQHPNIASNPSNRNRNLNFNMPPQMDRADTCDENAVPSPSDKAENNAIDSNGTSAAEGSYWEAPKEVSLIGKSVSMLDMTALESNHPEEQQQKKDDYWEAEPEECLQGKTLSGLDMKLLGNPHKTPSDEAQVLAKAETKAPSPKTSESGSITAEEPETETEAAPSYWDAPKESGLKGKTLSTLDMATLESNHPDEQREKKDDYWGGTTPKETKEEASLMGKTLSTLDMIALENNHPGAKQERTDNYWGATPKEDTLEGKTLSTLDMTALESNHPDEKKVKTDSYWDAPVEDKLKGKTLSTINISTLETTSGSAATSATEEETSGGASYWDDAPIDKSLEGKRLSSIDMAAMSKQHVDEKPAEATPYWDWKVSAFRKTLSKLSLSNLRKGSGSDVVTDDDDCVHGGSNNNGTTNAADGNGGSAVKPITNKKHKLRDSWRKSFQRLSTNNLDELDESGKGRRFGSRIFKSRNALDWSNGSRGSQMSIGEDAIMF